MNWASRLDQPVREAAVGCGPEPLRPAVAAAPPGGGRRPAAGTALELARRPTFSLVLPYYNEARYLPRTLASWLAQTRLPDQLVLIDNGSTDGSEEVCRRMLRSQPGLNVCYLREPRPGKVHALEVGCAALTGSFAVLADADTYYPPHYLELCATLAAAAAADVVAIMAIPLHSDAHGPRAVARRAAGVLLSHLTRRGLVGGHGQVLRTDALRRAGGFSTRHWEFVLLDHEILNRLRHHGSSVYHFRLWCQPSRRRADRRRVRWSAWERALYFLTPDRLQDWYFYEFLGPRLARRKMGQLNLRDQPWHAAAGRGREAPASGRQALPVRVGLP